MLNKNIVDINSAYAAAMIEAKSSELLIQYMEHLIEGLSHTNLKGIVSDLVQKGTNFVTFVYKDEVYSLGLKDVGGTLVVAKRDDNSITTKIEIVDGWATELVKWLINET